MSREFYCCLHIRKDAPPIVYNPPVPLSATLPKKPPESDKGRIEAIKEACNELAKRKVMP